LVNLTAEWNDFDDSAAMVEALDLVITVDTAIAHLAGALGKPVWILLAPNPDWRWLLEREDSPWYPTARLFRRGFGEPRAAQVGRVLEAFEAWRARRP
jgi:ADP-heptose:LPS heptosyltransferase